jgi:predicted Ser/Thr protein kinase
MGTQVTLLKGRYSIIKLLGRGGMGEVFLAEDQLLSRNVAVKKVLYSGNEFLFKAAEKEAMVLARLQHQGLPKVLDYFNEDHTQFIVMEYIGGKDLGELLRLNHGPFSTDQVSGWVDSLLDILEYLHRQTPPVVHRDIKPQNIKLTDDKKLFLIDFGLVKDSPTRVKVDSPSLSVYGYSQSYAPLEQINGDPTSVQTDVYELCATLYHLLTNVKPADALDRATKRIEHKPDPLRPAHEVNASVPLSLSQVLEAGLELSCDERIKSVQALRQRLQETRNRSQRIHINFDQENKNKNVDNRSRVEREPESPKTGFLRNKRTKYVVGAVLLFVLCVAGYMLYQSSAKRQEARGLFAEAQAIERAEGLLSQNACAKYEQIKSEYLDNSTRSELIKKSNNCTTARVYFQAAEKVEKDKGGLTFETIKEYKKIIETNPGSVYARQAQEKVNEYERNERATLKAYKAMQKADYLSARDDSEEITPELFKQRAKELLETINLYGEIDLTNVDPLLSDHIRNSIEAFKRGRSLFDEIEQERSNLDSSLAANLRTYGNGYRDYFVQQATSEFAKVLQNNASRFQTFKDEIKKLDELDKTIASQLEAKFNNKAFVDQY